MFSGGGANEDVLADTPGTFTELNSIIAGNESGSTVYLYKDYVNSGESEGIVIDKEITIDGNGKAIDANGKSNIFKINATKVTLKNLVFLNGNATDGGAVYFNNTQTAVLENCKFINTVSENGTIYFTGGDLTIEECEFINSSYMDNVTVIMEKQGYTVSVSPSSCIMYVNSTGNVVISKSKFKNSTISSYGINIEHAENVTFEDNIFSDNLVRYNKYNYNELNDQVELIGYTIGYGSNYMEAVVFINASDVVISNSQFEKNNGGALLLVLSENLTIANYSVRDSNIASAIMGGVNLTSDVSDITIENVSSIFYDYTWNPLLNNYTYNSGQMGSEVIFLSANIQQYSPAENLNNNISLKQVSIKDCHEGSEVFIGLMGNNVVIDDINVANVNPTGVEIYWEEEYGYIEHQIPSEIGLFYIDSNSLNISNINVSNVKASEVEFLYGQNRGNLTISNISVSDVEVGEAEVFIYIHNQAPANSTAEINSISINHVDVVGYSMEDNYGGGYFKEFMLEEGIMPIMIQGENTTVVISDVSVNNSGISTIIGLMEVDGAKITNVSAYNSTMFESEGSIFVESKGDVTLENIVVDKLVIQESMEIMQGYEPGYGEYNEGYINLEMASPGILIVSQNGEVSLKNITISNAESASQMEGLIAIQAKNNVTLEDINLINITDRGHVEAQYDDSLKMFVYTNTTGEINNGLMIYSENGNVSLSNLNVDDIVSGPEADFLEINAYDIIFKDISIRNSKISVTEGSGMSFSAENNVIIDNFTAENIEQAPGMNTTSYNYDCFKYTYDYELEGGEAGFGLRVSAGNNATLTDISFTNVVGGSTEGIVYVEAINILADDISLENITTAKSLNIEYNSDLAEYIYEISDTYSFCGFVFTGYGITNLTNINVDGVKSAGTEKFFYATGENVTLENLSVSNSKLPGAEGDGITITANCNAFVKNVILDNLSRGLEYNRTYYNEEYYKYVWEYESTVSRGVIGLYVTAHSNATLDNINMTNINDAGYEIVYVDAGNVTVSNMFFEDISPSKIIRYEYDPYLNEYLYEIDIGYDYSSRLDISGSNVNISNIEIINLTSNYGLLESEGDNISIENFSVKNSAISGEDSSVNIYASEYLTVNNFTADNISKAPGTNSTHYEHQYGRYVYDYYSPYGGFSVRLDSGKNISASDLTFTNIEGGSYEGLLTLNSQNLTVDSVLIENITPFDQLHIEYVPNLAKHICTSNYSMGTGGGIYSYGYGGISKFYNIIVNNVPAGEEESPIFVVYNDESILENITLSNVDSVGSHGSYYDSSTNKYYTEIYFESEEMIYIEGNSFVNITNMLIDNVPCSEEGVCIGGNNITIDNATFKNILSRYADYRTDDDGQLVLMDESNEGVPIYIYGSNILILNTNFENIAFGAYQGYGALYIYSQNMTLLENCTFKDIESQPMYYYYYNGGNPENETYDGYGGSVIIYGGNQRNIVNSKFINCSSDYGGAIYAVEALNITGSEFINCSAKFGGAIYIDGADLFINNTNFTQNKALNGGALFFTNQSYNNTVYNAFFLKNLAENNGGAVYIFETTENGTNIINASTFYLNHANYNGGAFFFNDTINNVIWDDYRWHNATASSRIHDDLTFVSKPLSRTMIIFSEFEDNSDYALNITAHNTAVGGNHTVTINIDEIAEGYVYVNITDAQGNFIKDKNGNEINGPYLLDHGKVTLELEDLPIGDYNVSAYYTGWEYEQYPLYYHVNSTIFSVYPHDLNVTANKTVFADENLTVIAKLNNLTTGTVNITVSNGTDTISYNDIPVVNGTVIYNITGLYAGDYNVTVTYNGDDIFYPKSNTTNFTVRQRDSKMDVRVEDNVYGNTTKIIVEVPEKQTGNVTVTINNQTYTKEVTDGTVVFEVPDLTAGEWEANVTFEENRVYKENNTLFKFNVTKANLTANAIGNNVTVKDNASFIIDVPDDFNGNVTIEIDGKTYYDGPVSELINITTLPAGTYTADVKFYGDKNYNDTKTQTSFNIQAVEPEMSVSITDAVYGGNATATIEVSGNANGTVNVTVDGKNYTAQVINGHGTVQINNVSAGLKEAEVKFITSDKYNLNATADATFTVNKANSTLVITKQGDDVVITTPKDATGNITVYVGAKEYTAQIINGTATLEDALESGVNSIVAFYDGDDNYLGSRNSTKIPYYKMDSFVNATATNSVYGGTTQVTVNVPIAQEGYVLITVNNVTYAKEIKNGVAVFNVTGLDVGNYPVNVTYLGNDDYKKNTNETSFNVTPAELNIIVEGLNLTVNDNASFVLHNMPSDFKGKVNITVDDVTYTRDVDSVVEIAKLVAGDKSAQVVFYGDENYNDLPLTVNFTISRFNDLINVTIKDITYTETAIADITVSGNANGNVTVIVDGKQFNGTVRDGVSSVKLTGLSAGAKVAVVKFITTDDYNSNATTTTKFNVNKANSTITITIDGLNVTATVNDGATGNVVFYINGKEESVKLNGTKATLENALSIGFNDIIAIYEGDNNYTGSRNNTNTTIGKNGSLVNVTAASVAYGNPSEITVNVPITQKGFVRITIDGTDINVTVEIKEGVAKYNVADLNVGNYTVYVTYLGDDIHDMNTNETSFNVTPADLGVSVEGLNLTVNDNASFILHNIPSDFKGKVNITVDGVTYTRDVDSVVEIAKLAAGDKSAQVVFYGDENYNDLPLTVNFTISRSANSINVTIKDITYNETAVADITVSGNANGNVTVIVDGKQFNGTVRDGVSSVKLTGLSAGAKVAVVKFITTDDYSSNATATARFDVNKLNSTIVIDVDKVYIYNETIVINLTTTGSNGIVNVTINGKDYPVTANKQVIIEKITSGEYTIIADLAANENYTSATNSTTFKVKKAETSITIGVNSIYKVGDDIIIILTIENSTGDVNVTVNGKEYTVADDKVTIIGGLEANDYIINAILNGNDNYTGSSDTKSFKVVKSNINITLADITESIVVGSPVTFDANLNESVTGDVIFTINGANYTVHISDSNVATYQYTPVNNATITVVATFAGNDKYNANVSALKSFNVAKITSLVNVTAANVNYGNSSEITVNVPITQRGFVRITIDGTDINVTVEIKDGIAKYNADGLNAGNYTVNVIYLGDNQFDINANETSFKVTPADLGVSVEGLNLTVNDNASFIIHNIPSDFNGKVNITVDDVTYVRDVDSLVEVAKLAAGDKTAQVVFYGDENYNDLPLTVEFTISRFNDIMNVTIKDITYTETAVADITVSGNANGNVTVLVDGKQFNGTVKDGVASVNLTGLSGGAKVAVVKFITTDNYNTNATTTTRFDVNRANSTITVEVDGLNVVATVNDGATGNVIFYVNGKEESVKLNGTKAVLENVLNIGFNDIIAIYEGDINYTSSRDDANTTVPKKSSLVNVTATSVTYGNASEIVVNVPTAQTGFVRITINATGINATIEIRDGIAKYNATGLNAGNYTVTATYLGDSTFDVNTNQTVFTVTKSELGEVTAIIQNVTSDQNATVFVSVPDDFKGKVNITVDNKTYTGDANTPIVIDQLTAGNKTAVITVYGDENYGNKTFESNFTVKEAIVLSTINAEDMTRGYNSPYDYQAAFLDSKGEALANATVIFKINGKEYTARTNESGIAQLTTSKLAVGSYNVTIINTVTGEETTKKLEIVKRILENKDLTMDYRDGSKFVVKVIGDDGNIAPEGEIICIQANGVNYVAKVDKKGYAILKITLLPKNYKITAEYKGFKTSNKLVVKQILKAVKKTTKVKKSKKSFKLKASLKYSNGKALKGKKITFKIKGKKYSAKTNKKGIATVKVKKNVIKKLKKGKKYTVKITYAVKEKYGNAYQTISDTVKCYVKVK